MEPSEQGDDGEKGSGDGDGGEVAFPEIGLGKVAGLEVVTNVGFDDPFAENGPFSIAVGVFQPMENARGKIDGEDDADGLHNNEPDFE